MFLKATLEGKQDAEACAARSICKLVGYLPLALALLRNNLKEDSEVPLVRLFAALKQRGTLGVAEALVEVFRLSWELVRDKNAGRLFQLAAYFPEAAPISLWLLGMASGLGENGQSRNFYATLGV